MSNFKRKLFLACIILVIASLSLTGVLFSAVSSAQSATNPTTSSPFQPQALLPNVELSSNQIYVGVWINNIFDFRYTTGDSTLDMYLYFFWTNSNLTTIDWQFANGYPVNPNSITLISDNSSSGIRYQIYRATAHFSTEPDARDYPFDPLNITVIFDVNPHGNAIGLQWLSNQTGVDPRFENSGWETTGIELSTSNYLYPLEITVPRAEMVVTQVRQDIIDSLRPFIAPIIFAVVCACSFFFNLREKESVATRLGLITSMLVTLLLFDFTQENEIPPSAVIDLYSVVIISIILFMTFNLIVTIFGAYQWAKHNNEKIVNRINHWGLLASIVVPLVVFLVLYVLRPH
jgi:hypothetical protein